MFQPSHSSFSEKDTKSRFLEGVANAAANTAMLSILMQIFPGKEARITAWAEMSLGLGYMLGIKLCKTDTYKIKECVNQVQHLAPSSTDCLASDSPSTLSAPSLPSWPSSSSSWSPGWTRRGPKMLLKRKFRKERIPHCYRIQERRIHKPGH